MITAVEAQAGGGDAADLFLLIGVLRESLVFHLFRKIFQKGSVDEHPATTHTPQENTLGHGIQVGDKATVRMKNGVGVREDA